MKVAVIIPAAGAGKRMRGEIPKQFMELNSRPMLVHTLTVFEHWAGAESVVVVVPENEQDRVAGWTEDYQLKKIIQIVCGGPRRQDSVYNGLRALRQEIDIVLVHDGVRPMISTSILDNCAEAVSNTGAAIAAVPIKDTIKEIADDKMVIRTLDRNRLWAVQTPQGFRKEILMRAMEQAAKDSFTGTDEASLVERLKIPITVVEGCYKNIKITTAEDLLLAETFLKARKNS
jgi:2-C-methyl-D-erythritol 4-phosphate cytidylyltransferase